MRQRLIAAILVLLLLAAPDQPLLPLLVGTVATLKLALAAALLAEAVLAALPTHSWRRQARARYRGLWPLGARWARVGRALMRFSGYALRWSAFAAACVGLLVLGNDDAVASVTAPATVRMAPADMVTVSSSDGAGVAVAARAVAGGPPFEPVTAVQAEGTAEGTMVMHGAQDSALHTFMVDITDTIIPGGPPKQFSLAVDEKARYTFATPAGRRVSVALTGWTSPGRCTLGLRMLRPDGSLFRNADNCDSYGDIYMDNPASGGELPGATYTLLVDPGVGIAGGGTLTLYDTPDLTGSLALVPGPTGAAVSLNFPVPGQHARYTFTVAAGQHISAKVTGWTSLRSRFTTVASSLPAVEV